MNEHTIVLLARTSNRKHIDKLLGQIMGNPDYQITKLEYNKEFKNWCIWGFWDETKPSTTEAAKEDS